MKQIIIKMPETQEELKELKIYELEKGCRKKMEERWRSWILRATFLGWKEVDGHNRMQKLYPPFNCEFCKHVGTEFWHCHNPKSFKCHINVNRNDLCSEFEPNMGLILMLWYQFWLKKCEEDRKRNIKFINKLTKKSTR